MNLYHVFHVPIEGKVDRAWSAWTGAVAYHFIDAQGLRWVVAYAHEDDQEPAWKRDFPSRDTAADAIYRFFDEIYLQRRADRPLRAAAEQKPCDIGLFDEAASAQLDLVEAARRG